MISHGSQELTNKVVAQLDKMVRMVKRRIHFFIQFIQMAMAQIQN
jgi:hypothetical protein